MSGHPLLLQQPAPLLSPKLGALLRAPLSPHAGAVAAFPAPGLQLHL